MLEARVGNGGAATLQGRQTDRKPHFSTLYFNTLHCVVGEALVHFTTLLCTGDIALGTECWEYPHLLVPPSLYLPPSQICHTPIDNIFTPILSLFPHICGHFLKRVLEESIFNLIYSTSNKQYINLIVSNCIFRDIKRIDSRDLIVKTIYSYKKSAV